MKGAAALVLVLALADPVRASHGTLHPLPRPAGLNVTQAVATFAGTMIRPQPRPVLAAAAPAPLAMLRPQPRPDLAPPAEVIPVAAVQKQGKPRKGQDPLAGSLCQRPEIRGKLLQTISSPVKGCTVTEAVQVSEIAGVTLSPPATINCTEARALSDWITTGLQPNFGNQVVRLQVADSYACRPRNNVRGNPVSVHGLGQAIDISGVVTASGNTYTVSRRYDARLKRAQKAGCAMFSTILGPGSDGYHENHIHFDVAQHGGGHYCR